VRKRVELTTAPSAGDLGAIAGVVRVNKVDTPFGETGGAVIVGGKRIPRRGFSIQPFALTDGVFSDIAAVTAHTSDVGVLNGRPATAMDVIHIGTGKPTHRGVFFGARRRHHSRCDVSPCQQ
jgi:NaMN:DMB phosphoribosyltransferase